MTRFSISMCLISSLMAANGAIAEPVAGKAAKAMLFAPVKAEADVLPEAGLTSADAQVLALVAEGQLYFGAIAISPDEGLMSEATVAAANYHDVDAARKAALAECEKKRTGATACLIAAEILPKGWKEQPLQLSSDATAAFAKDYDFGGTAAFAISAETGVYGLGLGEDAEALALKDCAAKSDAAHDCTVVILN